MKLEDSSIIAVRNRKYAIRYATLNDVDKILALDQFVWGDMAATQEMIESRIKTYSKGQIIAKSDVDHVVGWVSIQLIKKLDQYILNWNKATDNGTIRNTHSDKGRFIFGINLTAHPNHPGIGLALQLRIWSIGVQYKIIGGYIGSRIPSYHRVYKRYSIEQWVYGKNGKSYDAEVRYYQNAGFKIIKIIPDYFIDPESLNYGVLMYVPNYFYRFPFKRLLSFLINRYSFKLVRKFFK